MTDPEGQPSVFTAYALSAAGKYADALAQLDQVPETGVSLWMRGVALHHLKRAREAYDALERARPLLTGTNLARLLNDQAYFYTLDRHFRRAIETYVAAQEASVGDPVMQPLVTYNLGWLYLSRLEFESAHEHLQAAAVMAELAPDGERLGPRVGLSTLDRATGQLAAARHRARLATDVAQAHPVGNLAYRTYGHALRQLGNLPAAREAQQRAVDLAVADVYKANERMILGIIDVSMGKDVHLAALEDGALALDVTRSLLHRAEQARRGLQEPEMRRLLRAALDQREPFPVWDEAPLLPELYALGRSMGFTAQELPARRHTFPPATIEIGTVGRATLVVAGRTLPIGGKDIGALTLMAYLALHRRVVTARELGEHLYDSLAERSRASRLRRDVRDIAAWLGDPSAVTIKDDFVALSSDWLWSCDVSLETLSTERPHQVFLPRGRGAWVDEVRRRREDPLEGD